MLCAARKWQYSPISIKRSRLLVCAQANLQRWLAKVGARPAVQAGGDVPIKRDRAAEIEAAKKTGPKMLS
jgi:hypothetical protein